MIKYSILFSVVFVVKSFDAYILHVSKTSHEILHLMLKIPQQPGRSPSTKLFLMKTCPSNFATEQLIMGE